MKVCMSATHVLCGRRSHVAEALLAEGQVEKTVRAASGLRDSATSRGTLLVVVSGQYTPL